MQSWLSAFSSAWTKPNAWGGLLSKSDVGCVSRWSFLQRFVLEDGNERDVTRSPEMHDLMKRLAEIFD